MGRKKKKVVQPIRRINPALFQKSRDDVGKGLDISWLYGIILKWEPEDKSYPHLQGQLSEAKTKLFDQIVDELEKRYHEPR